MRGRASQGANHTRLCRRFGWTHRTSSGRSRRCGDSSPGRGPPVEKLGPPSADRNGQQRHVGCVARSRRATAWPTTLPVGRRAFAALLPEPVQHCSASASRGLEQLRGDLGGLFLRGLVAEKAASSSGHTAREGRNVIADDAREVRKILRQGTRLLKTAQQPLDLAVVSRNRVTACKISTRPPPSGTRRVRWERAAGSRRPSGAYRGLEAELRAGWRALRAKGGGGSFRGAWGRPRQSGRRGAALLWRFPRPV